MTMRVLVSDDDPQVRSAIRLLMEQEGDLVILPEAGSAKDLLEQVACGCPDLLLVDWELTGVDPVWLMGRVRQLCPHLVVIALSGRPEAYTAALSVGVDGFVSKGDPPEQLLRVLRRAVAGRN